MIIKNSENNNNNLLEEAISEQWKKFIVLMCAHILFLLKENV